MNEPATADGSSRAGAGAPADREVSALLYEQARKIYPRKVTGRFATLRLVSVLSLLGLYYATPWLTWEGRQALLLDLPARKFHLFAWTFWPQDFVYLALMLALAAMSLFFFTALAGRLWCGYACPQTAWTEAFLAIERFIEGDRARQMRLDAAPWSARKLRIKALKHGAWVALALWTGFTFVGYFTPIRQLASGLAAFSIGPWEAFWILFYSFATWGNAGFLREQVCKYMCPYARFQSAMFDRDTLIVTFDTARGEPRGSRRRSDDARALGLGDCIDCTMCVQVCPTGIDIRQGLQYECIACSACVDVCDGVMDKMGYPRGLIRYDTQNGVEGRPTRVLRPRILVYGAILLALFAAFGWSMSQRVTLGLDVIRDRNQLYRETAEGLIENVYLLKVINMHGVEREYTLSVAGIDGARLVHDRTSIRVPGGEVLELPVSVQAAEEALSERSTALFFTLSETGVEGESVIEEARFLGPRP